MVKNNTQSEKIELSKQNRLTVSLKTLASQLDADRSSVRRWLREAEIKPIVFGQGRNGAIRYKWNEVLKWLDDRERVE